MSSGNQVDHKYSLGRSHLFEEFTLCSINLRSRAEFLVIWVLRRKLFALIRAIEKNKTI